MTYDQRHAAALAFIREAHAGQTRADGSVPAWFHLARVSETLRTVLEEAGEGTADEREAIALSGLGHDALEDTEATPEDMERLFGARGRVLIEGMTNRYGDDHPAPYVKQVADAEEGVRLIKLADLYDNCTSVAYDLFVLGPEWTESFFLPIVTPMMEAVLPTEFPTYPKTAERLKGMVGLSRTILLSELARYKEKARQAA